jgi:hypothetical protein
MSRQKQLRSAEIYRGCWDIWLVRCYPNFYAWRGRPTGTQTAAVSAGSLEEVADALSALMWPVPETRGTVTGRCSPFALSP